MSGLFNSSYALDGIEACLNEAIPGVCWSVTTVAGIDHNCFVKGLWPDGVWNFRYVALDQYPWMHILTVAISMNDQWIEGGH